MGGRGNSLSLLEWIGLDWFRQTWREKVRMYYPKWMAGALISSFSLSFSAALSLQVCASFLICLFHSISICPAAFTLILASLKRQCHEIFVSGFFANHLPQTSDNSIRVISNFFENSRRYLHVTVANLPPIPLVSLIPLFYMLTLLKGVQNKKFNNFLIEDFFDLPPE
jgi:hypothetical protein